MDHTYVNRELSLFPTRSSAWSARPGPARTISSGWRGTAGYSTGPVRASTTSSPSGSPSSDIWRRVEPGKTRQRTVYTLTDKGLEALAAWARTAVRFTPVKSELLLRLLIADLVGEAVARKSITTIRRIAICSSGSKNRKPSPRRVPPGPSTCCWCSASWAGSSTCTWSSSTISNASWHLLTSQVSSPRRLGLSSGLRPEPTVRRRRGLWSLALWPAMRMQTSPAGGALTNTGAPKSLNVISTFAFWRSEFPVSLRPAADQSS